MRASAEKSNSSLTICAHAHSKKKFFASEDVEDYIFLSEHIKSTAIIGSLIFRLVLTTKYKVKLKEFF